MYVCVCVYICVYIYYCVCHGVEHTLTSNLLLTFLRVIIVNKSSLLGYGLKSDSSFTI
jgi:hypothetical protein